MKRSGAEAAAIKLPLNMKQATQMQWHKLEQIIVQNLTEAVAQLLLSRPRSAADKPTGRGQGWWLKSLAVTSKSTPGSSTVEGTVDGYPIQMLVDMGSMVTSVKKIWSSR